MRVSTPRVTPKLGIYSSLGVNVRVLIYDS